MPPSETISWECRGQCHCSWANQNSFKAQCCINAGVPASIKSEWCAFGVNCTWSIDAICMLITVWPFVSLFIPSALSRCEQVKWPTFSSDTSHMTLPSSKCAVSLYCITNTNIQTALITAAGAGAASSPWQMAQQQHSSTAPGPKEQMLDYRTLSGAFIFEEILDLTWLLLSSCHSERQQKPLKTRLCRPLAQPGATMSAGITTVWLNNGWNTCKGAILWNKNFWR